MTAMTRIMLEASSASGSWEYLFVKIVTASALSAWKKIECRIANHIFTHHSYFLYIFITAYLHLGPVKILSTHQRALKVSDFRASLLQESLEFELRLLRMQKDGLDLFIVSVLVMEIAEKTRDSFECNVPRNLNSI